jgi:AcrR family transcriptional regulator
VIEKAGQRFKQDGIDGSGGSGISTLMADAGLTNGAFYAHFASKDDLVAHVVADQLRTQVEGYDTLRPGCQGLKDFVRDRLSPEHRDQPGTGRCTDDTRKAYTEGATAIMEEIAARPAPADPQSAHGLARWSLRPRLNTG